MQAAHASSEYAPLAGAHPARDSIASSPNADDSPQQAAATVARKPNRDVYRAFVLGTFAEEGYVHVPPPPMAPSPFDRTYRCISTLLLTPVCLLLAVIALAHSGWWTAATSAGEVAVGDTANFRAIARFAATANMILYWQGIGAPALRLCHSELAMSGTASSMSASERLLRFASQALSWDIRLGFCGSGCALMYSALCQPSVDSLSVMIGRTCYGGCGFFIANLSMMRYHQATCLLAGPHVRNKTSLRAQCAGRARDTICVWLLLLIVFLRFSAYFTFKTEIRAMVESEECASSSSSSIRNDCRWFNGFEGRAQCELNCIAVPAAVTMTMFFAYEKLVAYGFSLTDLFSKLQPTGTFPAYAFVLHVLAASTIVINLIAVSIGLDDVGLCNVLGYATWAPWLAFALIISVVLPPTMVIIFVEQRCSSRALRQMNLFRRAIMEDRDQVGSGLATELGVRESRWDLHGEFSAFLSHYKVEAAGDARHLKDRLVGLLGAPVFLDSDDLLDLRELLRIVARSDVLLLLQTSNVLTRAWCLLELYTAILNHVPIVAVNVQGSFPYSFSDAVELLDGTDEEDSTFADRLSRRSPGTVDLIRKQQVPVRGVFRDVDIEELGRVLHAHLPNILSNEFQPSASANVIDAQLEDIIETMEQVKDSLVMEQARAELLELKPSALEKRARRAGVSEEALEAAKDADLPLKESLVGLILGSGGDGGGIGEEGRHKHE